jgi:signal transduction histidine kinase
VLAGGVTLAFAVASVTIPRGPWLTAISDVGYFLLTLAASVAMVAAAWSARDSSRRFWALMAAGGFFWTANQAGWVYCEVLRHVEVPDPWFMDIFLFLHLVPMIAAVGLRPHRTSDEQKSQMGALDFFLLLVWWMFLYAFTVFPWQYISANVAEYDRNYGALYLIESGVLVLMLGMVARRAPTPWRRVYLNLMGASALYALDSQAVNLAVAASHYYTGGFYDVVLIGAAAWMAAIALTARDSQPEAAPLPANDKWNAIALQLAMLAILSLPLLGVWVFRWDPSPAPARIFRLFTILAAMLVLGGFVFLRQYVRDQALIRLLENSRRSFENERRLQSHLVQREKLASLGQLVAGAAHEIGQPLAAVVNYAEKLWSNQHLTSEQDKLVRKIVGQAQRTVELVSSLLSFAQQSSGQKAMVDLSTLLQRSVQMRELQLHDQKIRIEMALEPNLPEVWGNGHQLFQVFVQLVENALDALEEAGGGLLRISAQRQADQVSVQFADSGPGIREPHRVFDPFYTTKPVGKGTGLGLSAVYGMVQDHKGLITCQNRAEGGALFEVVLPIASGQAGLAAGAAQ